MSPDEVVTEDGDVVAVPVLGGDVSVSAADNSIDLSDPSFYFNRQVSWMDFNDRVLQLVEDPGLPLLERVKFCAITESNLDEFFMVRVAGLHDQVDAALDGRGADGMTASEQIDAVREKVIGQRARLDASFDGELRPALAEYGIRIIDLRGGVRGRRA